MELRALRPAARDEFIAELDALASMDFERRAEKSASPPRRLIDRVRTMPRRLLLAPAAATAVLAVVVATAIFAGGRPGGDGAQVLSERGGSGSAQPGRAAAPSTGSDGTQHSDAAPSNGNLSGSEVEATGAAGAASFGRRDVERDANLVLRADPDRVAAVSKGVFAAVHSVHGIVLRSSIEDRGASGAATASFELLIPSARLGDAMASLSRLATVRSWRESTLDITAPTVSAGDRLRDSEARIEALLAQLAGAAGDEERATVEAELRRERRRAAALRGRVERLARRSRFARVSVWIEGDAGAGAGGWGVEDALGSAGRILAVAAGVVVIGLAILGPLALIVLLAWLVSRTWVRRRREAALD
ncbi:MAG TPA: DUF4349 domain-containing protein [Solirubrobacterales bacterium]